MTIDDERVLPLGDPDRTRQLLGETAWAKQVTAAFPLGEVHVIAEYRLSWSTLPAAVIVDIERLHGQRTWQTIAPEAWDDLQWTERCKVPMTDAAAALSRYAHLHQQARSHEVPVRDITLERRVILGPESGWETLAAAEASTAADLAPILDFTQLRAALADAEARADEWRDRFDQVDRQLRGEDSAGRLKPATDAEQRAANLLHARLSWPQAEGCARDLATAGYLAPIGATS